MPAGRGPVAVTPGTPVKRGPAFKKGGFVPFGKKGAMPKKGKKGC
jgi:hypothetical protein